MEDFEVFLKSSTPIVKNFLHNCFNSNRLCNELDNIEWPMEANIVVKS
jgi:hypothetical protein